MTTIRFDSKFQIIAQLFDSIQNEKNTIRTALAQQQDTLTRSSPPQQRQARVPLSSQL